MSARQRPNPQSLNEKTERPTIIGVISDTHGLLRPEAVEALRGSDRILDAGDVGTPEILQALAKIAPVTAIRGNVDTEPWARRLPKAEVVDAGGIPIYMLHDLSELDLKPEAAGFQVVIYGHSHQPKIERSTASYISILEAQARAGSTCR